MHLWDFFLLSTSYRSYFIQLIYIMSAPWQYWLTDVVFHLIYISCHHALMSRYLNEMWWSISQHDSFMDEWKSCMIYNNNPYCFSTTELDTIMVTYVLSCNISHKIWLWSFYWHQNTKWSIFFRILSQALGHSYAPVPVKEPWKIWVN